MIRNNFEWEGGVGKNDSGFACEIFPKYTPVILTIFHHVVSGA